LKTKGNLGQSPGVGRPRPTPAENFMSNVQHETVYFSGHVQGVGFRYTALHVAREFEVAGFVRNLPDGRVLLEAEGATAEIAAFVRAIEEAMPGYIRNVERRADERPPQFRGFAIR
jgi:acylphosphatase